jgi:hypothetical protein
MKFFLESIKRSFKEIAGRWWFLFAFLSMHMIGILTSLVGIFMMFVPLVMMMQDFRKEYLGGPSL